MASNATTNRNLLKMPTQYYTADGAYITSAVEARMVNGRRYWVEQWYRDGHPLRNGRSDNKTLA